MSAFQLINQQTAKKEETSDVKVNFKDITLVSNNQKSSKSFENSSLIVSSDNFKANDPLYQTLVAAYKAGKLKSGQKLCIHVTASFIEDIEEEVEELDFDDFCV